MIIHLFWFVTATTSSISATLVGIPIGLIKFIGELTVYTTNVPCRWVSGCVQT